MVPLVKQLKECLIVYAVSIFMICRIVNGFDPGIALWSRKATDWIFLKNVFFLDEKCSFMERTR